MSFEDKRKFLEKIKINVPAEEHETNIKLLVKHHNVSAKKKMILGWPQILNIELI